MKDRDKINWDKVRDLREQHETVEWLCNRLHILPVNDASHAIDEIVQEITQEVDGVIPGVLPPKI